MWTEFVGTPRARRVWVCRFVDDVVASLSDDVKLTLAVGLMLSVNPLGRGVTC